MESLKDNIPIMFSMDLEDIFQLMASILLGGTHKGEEMVMESVWRQMER